MGINSYAQNFEDVLLWRALSQIERGFYIDVGAHDPVIDSVSLAFHERGWRGIHIEPIPIYAESLRQQRPGDLVLEAAVGKGPSVINFFEITGTGLSTADVSTANRHKSRGFDVREISVPCVSLADVFDRAGGREIHWLKIDVEGFEREVLSSWPPSGARPWIVVIESTLPLTQIESHLAWESILLGMDYTIAYFDGLNRYYVSSTHAELKRSFSVPPNTFDDFTLNGTANAPFHRKIKAHSEQQIHLAEAQLKNLKQEMNSERVDSGAREESLSLKLKETTRCIEEYKQLLHDKEVEFSAQLATIRSQALRELNEQELRHSASQTALSLELGSLRNSVSELEARATLREQEFSMQLQQEAELTRRREQSALREFRQSEHLLIDKLSALQTTQLQHVSSLEGVALADRRAAVARHDDLTQQLNSALANGRKVAEALATALSEIDIIKGTWRWRIFFATAKPSGSSLTNEVAVAPTYERFEHKASIEPPSLDTPHNIYMSENLEPYKPAKTLEALLRLNDYDFVQCAYLSILGRPADADGLANYVAHVRAGADRLDLIHALATSPEGSLLDPQRLPGLKEALRDFGKKRPSFISRRLAAPIMEALRPLFARMEVCEYRLSKLEQQLQDRLDEMQRTISSLAKIRQQVGVVDYPELTEVDKLTAHARSIYFQLKDGERRATGTGKPTP